MRLSAQARVRGKQKSGTNDEWFFDGEADETRGGTTL